MQINNINTNTINYRDKFSLTSSFKSTLNFDDYTQSTSSTTTTSEVAEISISTISTPTSSAILSTTVEPNPYGDVYVSGPTTTEYLPNGGVNTTTYCEYYSFVPSGENFLGEEIFKNNTAFGFQYTEDSTDERPLVEAITIDGEGNCIRQIIDVNAVDPTDCTATEFSALYLHMVKDYHSGKSEQEVMACPLNFDLNRILCNKIGTHEFDSYPSYDDKKNFLSIAQAYSDFQCSLPYYENQANGETLSNLLALFENIKNEQANWLIDNDSLFDAQLDEFDKQIQKQYEYSSWLKL